MYGLMYYSHNLQFLSDANMMQGRFADAQQAAQMLAKRLDGNPHAAMFPMVDSIIVGPISVLLRFNKSDDVLRCRNRRRTSRCAPAWRHFARGVRSGAHR